MISEIRTHYTIILSFNVIVLTLAALNVLNKTDYNGIIEVPKLQHVL